MTNFNNGGSNKCPICGREEIEIWVSSINDKLACYGCPVCGNFFARNAFLNFRNEHPLMEYNTVKLKSYLLYHPSKKRAVFLIKDDYEKYITDEYVEVYNLTPEMVEMWYPKTFAERIDYILIYLAKNTKFIGESILIPIDKISELFFFENSVGNRDWNKELKFIMRYLGNQQLIENPIKEEDFNTFLTATGMTKNISITLSAKAWERIYELQKVQSNNKDVFVAMSFHESAKDIRRAIKQGIDNAEYSSLLMDEIVHNHQIVPEMLRLIKESRFMIMDITQPNFGAYYEAGYAQGLGKEVIITCSQEVWDKKDFSCDKDDNCLYKQISTKPHFDIAQKQVLVWKDYSDLTKKLTEWVKHLIG